MNIFNFFKLRLHIVWQLLCTLIVASVAVVLQKIFLFRMEYVYFSIFLAVMLSLVLFRVPAETVFRKKIIAMFDVYNNYLRDLIDAIYQKENTLAKTRLLTENVLLAAPNWVYAKGYNARLREGHRHFLVRVEQIGEILISLQALTHYSLDKRMLKQLEKEIYFVIEQTRLLMQSINNALALEKPKAIIEDWYDKIQELEKIFYEALPENFMMLEGKEEHLHIAELLQGLKDLRFFLLKCVQAIR